MKQILGITRLAATLVILIISTLIILLIGWLPWRIQQRRPAAWVTTLMARAFTFIFNLKVTCIDSEKLYQHRGFIFPNHLSYLDIIVLVSLMPVRFLSMAEVRRYPLIGWIAIAIGTVFVARENEHSRQQARDAIVQSFAKEPNPPVVLFPEGKMGPGDQLLPFRHGAFEIAVEHGIAFLPCVLRYTPLAITQWHSGGLVTPIWQLAQFTGPLHVEVIPLAVVQPAADSDPIQLAKKTHRVIEQVLLQVDH
jgi:1-acyl-sn-glycerol-3-phosphate acyltransferase